MNSPIIIFSYNRPRHLNNLIDSLIQNKVSKSSKIFFFCDGPKNENDKRKITQIKNLLKKKKLKIYSKKFRNKNIGLANNIINGVSQVLKKHKNCIVLEDDLVINKNCIKFMNFMLNKFNNNKKIGSISAYSYIDDFYYKKKFDFYVSKRHSSWCWGTWSRVWSKIDWNDANISEHFNNISSIKKFSQGGKDLNLLLWGSLHNLINSWAIRFNFFCFKNSLKSIQPRYSMIKNDGRDFSGTHEKFYFKFNKKFNFNPKLDNYKNILKHIIENDQINFYIRDNHRRSIKLSLKFFFKYFKLI
ncbi:hypothetical protein [Candidatus Pelagibacter sp. HIMB1748]|uniref:hypothetical protein n=1 Tax=unclassified Candidatus Pelagibacter TaxID=2647897 RepID=UPI003F8794BE